jgi:hypothetical protein
LCAAVCWQNANDFCPLAAYLFGGRVAIFGVWNRAAIRSFTSIESAIRHLARTLKFRFIGSRRGERT